ncbi:MAG: DinB family protein [Terriglobales bacterium]
MRIAEVLLEDFDTEMGNTRRTLERIPEDQPDYRPHGKSMPVGRLAMHCATLPLFGYYVLADEGMDLMASQHPRASLEFTTRARCLEELEKSAAQCRQALSGATDAGLQATWPFRAGAQIISEASRLRTYRTMFFNHLVHHTSQLGVYLRLLQLPVPALYGPSADEQWTGK